MGWLLSSPFHLAKELSMTPLRQRMIEDMQVRNLTPRTQETYLFQVCLFARHFRRSPALLGPEEIRAYQLYLTNEKKLATSSILLAVASLRFLYQVTLHKKWTLPEVLPLPRKPHKLPVVLSPEQVRRFLEGLEGAKQSAVVTTCYAAGLRLSEALHLKTSDIDSQRMVIRVEQGKGHKDRYVMLSPRLLEILRSYWRVERPLQWLFSGGTSGQASCHRCGAEGLPQGPPSDRHRQTYYPAFVPTRLRRALAGIRHRRSHHSTTAGPSQLDHHRPLPPDCHEQGMRHHQPARLAGSSGFRCGRARRVRNALSGGHGPPETRSGGRVPPPRRSLPPTAQRFAIHSAATRDERGGNLPHGGSRRPRRAV